MSFYILARWVHPSRDVRNYISARSGSNSSLGRYFAEASEKLGLIVVQPVSGFYSEPDKSRLKPHTTCL
jgi:hypothetical protein